MTAINITKPGQKLILSKMIQDRLGINQQFISKLKDEPKPDKYLIDWYIVQNDELADILDQLNNLNLV
jgi:methionine-rich copper-binding protein CopC